MENCEYCKKSKAKQLVNEDGLCVFVDNDEMTTSYSDFCTSKTSKTLKISFCPMCGRTLIE